MSSITLDVEIKIHDSKIIICLNKLVALEIIIRTMIKIAVDTYEFEKEIFSVIRDPSTENCQYCILKSLNDRPGT